MGDRTGKRDEPAPGRVCNGVSSSSASHFSRHRPRFPLSRAERHSLPAAEGGRASAVGCVDSDLDRNQLAQEGNHGAELSSWGVERPGGLVHRSAFFLVSSSRVKSVCLPGPRTVPLTQGVAATLQGPSRLTSVGMDPPWRPLGS